MAKTPAERQKEYRLRRNVGDGDKRINSWVTTKTDLALERMARHYGVTKREMLEKLILNADNAILESVKNDDAKWDKYMNNKPVVVISNILEVG